MENRAVRPKVYERLLLRGWKSPMMWERKGLVPRNEPGGEAAYSDCVRLSVDARANAQGELSAYSFSRAPRMPALAQMYARRGGRNFVRADELKSQANRQFKLGRWGPANELCESAFSACPCEVYTACVSQNMTCITGREMPVQTRRRSRWRQRWLSPRSTTGCGSARRASRRAWRSIG
jgi:hypothetical protein